MEKGACSTISTHKTICNPVGKCFLATEKARQITAEKVEPISRILAVLRGNSKINKHSRMRAIVASGGI